MLEAFFSRIGVCERLRSGPAGRHLDGFAKYLARSSLPAGSRSSATPRCLALCELGAGRRRPAGGAGWTGAGEISGPSEFMPLRWSQWW